MASPMLAQPARADVDHPGGWIGAEPGVNVSIAGSHSPPSRLRKWAGSARPDPPERPHRTPHGTPPPVRNASSRLGVTCPMLGSHRATYAR